MVLKGSGGGDIIKDNTLLTITHLLYESYTIIIILFEWGFSSSSPSWFEKDQAGRLKENTLLTFIHLM